MLNWISKVWKFYWGAVWPRTEAEKQEMAEVEREMNKYQM